MDDIIQKTIQDTLLDNINQEYVTLPSSKEQGKNLKKIITKTDIIEMDQRFRANFVNSLTGFKPLNLVGTKSSAGQTNLAIISSVVHLGSSPALFGFVFRPDSSPRHSLLNIRETGFCTINHVNCNILKKAHQTSARYPKEVSEFEACGLSESYEGGFYAPYVEESNIKIGLKIVDEIKIQLNETHLVIGQVEYVSIPEPSLTDGGFVDIHNAESICGAGLDSYYKTEKLARLAYAKPDKKTEEI